MAPLSYRVGLARYRRYVQAVQERPLLQASVFVVFSLILIIMLVALALRPTLITITGLLGQISQQKQVEQTMDAKISSLAAASQNLQIAQAKLVILDQAIPTSAQFALWSQIVDSLASTQGLEITNITLGKIPVTAATPTSKLTEYPFTITIRGDYTQLRVFLQNLEQTRRLLVLENVTLINSITADTSTSLQLTVKGKLSFVSD